MEKMPLYFMFGLFLYKHVSHVYFSCNWLIKCNIAYLHARNMHVMLQLLWPALYVYVPQFPSNKTMTINLAFSPKLHNNIKENSPSSAFSVAPPKKQPLAQCAKLFGINF